jgi:hypothetical protein
VIAAGGDVTVYSLEGKQLEQFATSPGATAVLRIPNGSTLVGYRDGNIDVHTPAGLVSASQVSFEGVPSSAVTLMTVGPRNTVAVGYANGIVGVWDPNTGARLVKARLHGSVVRIATLQDRVYAVTELGRWTELDLSELTRPYCALLQDVWKRVPVIWENNRALVKAVPTAHRCSQP